MAASLPIPPQQPQISKICANCFVYEWKQLEPAALKNCSRCKVVRYCGADCQVEHWKVLHHKHCRKLAEARKAEAEGNLAGKLPVDIYSHHPFPITGLAEDIGETLVINIQRILAKMREASHPAFSIYPAQLMEMADRMATSRMGIWASRKLTPEELPGICTIDCCADLRTQIALPVACKNDSLDLWSTLHLLLGALIHCRTILRTKSLKEPCQSVPDELWTGLLKEVGVFPLRLKEVLKACGRPQFPPFLELLKIYCGGSLVQECTFCSLEITVAAVIGEARGLCKGSVPVVFHRPYAPPLFACTALRCQDQMENFFNNTLAKLTYTVCGIVSRLAPNRCDFCFKLAEGSHRFVRFGPHLHF